MSNHTLLAGAFAALALLAPTSGAGAQQSAAVSPAEASARVGSTLTICGPVADAQYLERSNRLTLLNFDKPFPDHTFTAVVLVSVRSQMRIPPEKAFLNKEVCVKGTVTKLRDQPAVMIASLDQVWVKK